MSKQKAAFRGEPGVPLPLGPSRAQGRLNFALFARHAESVSLVVDPAGTGERPERWQEIELDPRRHRTGDIWHVSVPDPGTPLCYGYRVNGTNRPGEGILFFPEAILIDPCCTRLIPRAWARPAGAGSRPLCLAGAAEAFDWQGDRPLGRPAAETIIYELHVRGFTRHPGSGVGSPGTFRGLMEKIPYLQDLGITAVELLPVCEWDETDNKFVHPETAAPLLNYWGYNPLSFFALRSGLAARPEDHVNEFKTLVRSLHRAGIEVILDMVFNHTGESDLEGTTSSLRGIDNSIYYLIHPETGDYLNFSGCGNAVNCNHPVVRTLILESLRYWVREMHVDGFRFDLASLFNRGPGGEVLARGPLVELIAEDPLLRTSKIIAEPWDAAGLYQVGSFSADRRWLEWNGAYRDDLRRFLAGHPDTVSTAATRIAGSSDLYEPAGRTPLNSVNFITSHDGFTLADLVSYNDKHNFENGENGRDGEDHNISWNSGHEGVPCPPDVELLRRRRIRSFMALLLLSQGVPMLTAGDEFGRSQKGNNNCWCQDNELSWLDWSLAETNRGLLRFTRHCIELRKTYPHFRRAAFFHPGQPGNESDTTISWQAERAGVQDWSASTSVLGFLLHPLSPAPRESCAFFVGINAGVHAEASFTLPEVPGPTGHTTWLAIVESYRASPDDFVTADRAARLLPGTAKAVPPMGLIVLQSGTSSSRT